MHGEHDHDEDGDRSEPQSNSHASRASSSATEKPGFIAGSKVHPEEMPSCTSVATHNHEGAAPTDDAEAPVDLGLVRMASRGSAWLILTFIVSSIAGSAPRTVALLIANTMSPPVAVGTDAFRDMWSVCREPGRVWLAHDPEGIFYKVLVIMDHVLRHTGLCLFWIGILLAMFWDSPRSVRRTGAIFGALLVGLCVTMSGIVIWLHTGNVSMASLASMKGVEQLAMGLFGVLFCIAFLVTLAHSVYRQNRAWAPRTLLRELRFFPLIASIIWFGMMFTKLDDLISDLDQGPSSVSTRFVLEFGIGKFFLLVLRRWARSDELLAGKAASGFVFAINVFLSLYIRNLVHDALDYTLWWFALAMLGMAAIEFVAHSMLGWYYLMSTGTYVSAMQINSLTLDQLVDVNREVERRVHLFYGELWMDQLAEIFVCINIAAQNLAMSIWSQRFRWLTLDEYQQRAGAILAAVAIQLVIEIGMDLRVLRLCQRLVPVDVRRAMRTLASAKNVGKFAQPVRRVPCTREWADAVTVREVPTVVCTRASDPV